MLNPVRIPTHDAIIEAAFHVLNNNPGASIAEIAIAAGVGRATFHRHFSGREDLIRVMALQAIDEINTVADEASKNALSYSDALHKILKAIIPLGERQWFLTQDAAQNFPEIQTALKKQNTEFKAVLEKAQKEGLFPANCPIEWVMQSYDLLIYGAWQMVRDGHVTPSQAGNLAWQTFTNGIKKAVL